MNQNSFFAPIFQMKKKSHQIIWGTEYWTKVVWVKILWLENETHFYTLPCQMLPTKAEIDTKDSSLVSELVTYHC